MKNYGSTVRVFYNKRLWTLDQARNDRYLSYCVDEVPLIDATKLPVFAIMIGVVTLRKAHADLLV
ncbi:Hypothetical protein FKW44_003868 [Caligus rogercresseyi]|uniref:Uncharacterized protein n=1 Tax=Caligus rogercresseyi TaxID=217165 RepID=A0A7T8KM83_CALRO|nr:Hypothetical protein FKW44_003868 [Caligus rogercresseyi]